MYSNRDGNATTIAVANGGSYFMISMATFGAIESSLNITGTQVALARNVGWTRFLQLIPLDSATGFAVGSTILGSWDAQLSRGGYGRGVLSGRSFDWHNLPIAVGYVIVFGVMGGWLYARSDSVQ